MNILNHLKSPKIKCISLLRCNDCNYNSSALKKAIICDLHKNTGNYFAREYTFTKNRK